MILKRLKLAGFWVVLFFFLFGAESVAAPISPFSLFNKDSFASKIGVEISATTDPISIFPGSAFYLHIQVVISSGFHIYSLKENSEEGLETKILIVQPSLKPKGEWKESPPQITFDGVLGKAMKTHENLAEFFREFLVPNSVLEKTIVGQLIYRLCDNRVCSMPKNVEFQAPIIMR
tara:strand:- start:427 stop:954 length:528 start_codon:yes stop_codon:yes gene_type:complete